MKLLKLVLAAALVAVVPVLPAAAQTVPAGSYLKTCDTVRVKGGTLLARCATSQGKYYDTSISVAACAGAVDIANDQARLTCYTHNKTQWNGRVLPVGSYLKSCYFQRYENSTIVANCRKKNGGYNLSRLDLAQCPGSANISNLNGHLTCTP